MKSYLFVTVAIVAFTGAVSIALRGSRASYQSPAIHLPPGCSMLPENNVWNARIDHLPLDAMSRAYVESIGRDAPLHPDFGREYGYPYGVALNDAPETAVTFTTYAAASDRGPYRIALDAPIEVEGDRHVLVIDPAKCRLYELFGARRGFLGGRPNAGAWTAESGVSIDLRSNALRHDDWTSADASGMAMLPGLVRYQEVDGGVIRHALRFTARRTRAAHVWPARHDASRLRESSLPPMGQRFRLRASFDLSGFSRESRVILTALQQYGMFLADNGGAWYLSGAVDSRWRPAVDAELKLVKGSDFEAIDSSSLMKDPDSGEILRR